MNRFLSLITAFVLIFLPFMQTFACVVQAEANEQTYETVVLRGSGSAALDWGSNDNPLTYDNTENKWVSEGIPLTGGQKVEYKFVMDDNWMEGSNLVFTPPQSGHYFFVFHPENERTVDVRLNLDDFTGSLTLEVELPPETPDWITPTVASSLNHFNYTVTPMQKGEGGKWRVELAGDVGEEITYRYALGDKKYAELIPENRKASFEENGKLYEDVVSKWEAIPVAKNVSHDFDFKPHIPSSTDDVTITTTVEHYGPITDGGIYFTVDGSSPHGNRGVATNGEFVPMEVVSTNEENGLFTSMLTGVIPKQTNQTPVKYKVDVWDTNGEKSQFADTNSQTAEEATEFAYYVDEFTTPIWAKDATIYHIFVDRFKDGNESINYDVDESQPTEERLKGWMGGDLEGVIQELPYLQELGVNTLWISPVFEGPYSHGYHPADFKAIDRNFGTVEIMKELITEAHAIGMKVVYDFVPNHTSNQHPYFQDAYEKGTESPYYNWYTFTNWPSDYETFYGIGELPQLNNDNRGTRDYILEDVVPFWLEELNFDGFRLDYAKGPSYSYWVDFRHAVKQADPEAYIFGEVWDSREKINSYSGKLDGAVDFGFHDTFKDVFAKNSSFTNLQSMIEANLETYHPEYIMTSFLDNHDVSRFLHEAGNDVNKLKLASAAQFTLPGSPVIYYGTEVGLSQSKDHTQYTEWQDRWYREMMPWDESEQNLDILQHYKEIIKMRSEHSALRDGAYRDIHVERDVMAYERSDDNGTYLVLINKSAEDKQFGLADLYGRSSAKSATLTNVLNSEELTPNEHGEIDITIAASDFSVYQLKGELGEPVVNEPTEIPDNHIRIHYERTDNNFKNLSLWMWDDVANPPTTWPSGVPFIEQQVDSYGAYLDIELTENAQKIGFLVVNSQTGEKDGGDKVFTITSPDMNEIWIRQGSDDVFTYEPVDLPENTVRIHYDRADHNFANLGVWVWGDDVVSPSDDWPSGAIPFTDQQMDRYGAYVDIKVKEGAKNIHFLIVNRETEAKDGDNKTFSLVDRYKRLWIKNNDDTVYTSPYWEVPIALRNAELLSNSKMLLDFTMTEGLTEDELLDGLKIENKDATIVQVDSVEITGSTTVEVIGAFDTEKTPYSVTYSNKTVSAKAGWRMLDEMYHYEENDLGATYHENGNVTLKLWAPLASEVVVNFFDKDFATQEIGSLSLTKGEKGVWSLQLTAADLGVADLNGYYYQYEVTNNGVTKQVLDPYAKSMAPFMVSSSGEVGADGDKVGKAAIVDLTGTNPEGFGFANIEGYEKREDAIIWEVHVRDFTSDPSIEGDLNGRWGTYTSFVDKLEYIKSLGVTHVQLLPVMAWYYGDETNMNERELDYSAANNQYNWGYDPHSYFTPDGAYSEDAGNPELRIVELKELIHEIHEAGMGVILDNVYTHMASASLLEDIVPDYYFWKNSNGQFVGGFGSNLATNHKMAEKLMIDSVKYWFEEYKIDGMRWDMMGDATYESVQKAYDAAAEINENALFIGEGWRTFAGDQADPELQGKGADQDWMDKTDSVGVFSDEFRNELKSGFGSEGEARFITGGVRDIDVIFNNIKAQPGNTPADDPGDMVPYIEAHDNLPLYDVIAQSIKKDPAIQENNEEIHKRIRIGNTMVLTSQGTAFIHAGQEYGRTKQWKAEGVPQQKYHALEDENGKTFGYFIHDSYDSSDAINMFDWEKATNKDVYPINNTTREYTEGLIKLRRSTDAFRLGTKELIDANVTLINAPEIQEQDLVIGYKNVSSDHTGYYVFVNADNEERVLSLEEDLTDGKVLVDNDEAGVTEVSTKSGFVLTRNSITIEPLSTVIIKVDKDSNIKPKPIPLPTPEPPAPSPVDGRILVDNDVVNVVKEGDKVKITVKAEKMIERINLSNGIKILTFEVEDAQNREVDIPLQVVKTLKAKNPNGILEVRSNNGVAYRLPVQQLDVDKLAQQLEESIDNVHISIQVNEGKDQNKVITNNQLQLVSPIVEFTVNALVGDKKLNINQFSQYVERDIVGEIEFNPKRSTAVKLNNDGTFTPVPTKFNENKATIKSVKNSEYVVVENEKHFVDVPEAHWAKAHFDELGSKYIFKGNEAGFVHPQKATTRIQMVALITRSLGLVPSTETEITFKDVKGNEWFINELNAAVSVGIVKGKGDGRFAPNEPVTREQAATMIARAMNFVTYNHEMLEQQKELQLFKDHHIISDYAKNNVELLLQAGIINENDQFNPKKPTTRAQMAKMVNKYLSFVLD
ncbi:pullulanase [Halalkalibacter urbisdiaboli]|uniref:pullulanase n=1 Tax=Halalkalibacter urbisdiaboli TaxID=1960589 RepID=UPI001FD89D79|nr:pullulanase [Halalkalibacter urbisdiaboli]